MPRCRDVLIPTVHLARQGDGLRAAARVMANEGLDFLPVLGPDRRLVGAVTDREVALAALGPADGARATVADALGPGGAIPCGPEEELGAVAIRMARAGAERAVVLDGAGRCVGVISLATLARYGEAVVAGEVLRSVAARRRLP